MKKIFTIVILCFLVACSNNDKKTTDNTNQIVDTLKYEKLKDLISKQDDVLYVVNFWATWCKPCVQELPDFMEVNQKFKSNDKYKMILVSLDKASDLDTKVKPFLRENKITPDVYLLNDNKRMNEWIPAFDSNWDGAIPTTFIYKNGIKLKYIDKQINKTELTKTIQNYL